MARVDATPFSTFVDDVTTGTAGDFFKNNALRKLIPNTGLFGRKTSHLLFTGLGSSDSSNFGNRKRSSKEQRALSYPDVQVYVDPQKIQVKKRVIVNKILTRGGWINQFWGLDLPVITMNSYSGYFGVTKGRDPIQNEILKNTQMGVELKRARAAGSVGDGIKAIARTPDLDPLKIFERIKEYAFDNRFDGALPFSGVPIIKMIYEGVVYTGYFNFFNYNLDANKPFVIDYNFQFTVVAPAQKFQSLNNLDDIKKVFNANGLLRGLENGVVNTVAGGVQQFGDAARNKGTQALSQLGDQAGRKLGVKKLIDLTPSRVILA